MGKVGAEEDLTSELRMLLSEFNAMQRLGGLSPNAGEQIRLILQVVSNLQKEGLNLAGFQKLAIDGSIAKIVVDLMREKFGNEARIMAENPTELKQGEYFFSKRECPFFKICGAAIIREFCRQENWYNQFCNNNFEKCPHYESRLKEEDSPS